MSIFHSLKQNCRKTTARQQLMQNHRPWHSCHNPVISGHKRMFVNNLPDQSLHKYALITVR